jgi:hypothetical protein
LPVRIGFLNQGGAHETQQAGSIGGDPGYPLRGGGGDADAACAQAGVDHVASKLK